MRNLVFLPFLLAACLEPAPGPRPALDLPMPIAPTSITECWLAYICFDGCEDFECAIDCRARHPGSADQAGEAWYQAAIWGENDARNTCFSGAFG